MPDVQMSQDATCDGPGGCGHVWKPTLKVRARVDGGEEWLWHCPKCHKRYEVATITKRGREVRAELNRVRADRKMNPAAREAEIDRLARELRRESTNDVRGLTD